jgi:hypothetical protein
MQEIERFKVAVKDGTLPATGKPSNKEQIEQVCDVMQRGHHTLHCAEEDAICMWDTRCVCIVSSQTDDPCMCRRLSNTSKLLLGCGT